MHILIIPSEEFVPEYNHEQGIFQYHQARILQAAGHRVGALSISQSFSIPMLIKAIVYRSVNKNTGNVTDSMSIKQLLGLGYNKIFRPHLFLKPDIVNGITVYRINGFYFLAPSDINKKYGWVKAGLLAYKEYCCQYGKPDLIHAHNAIYAGMLSNEIKKIYKIPYLVTEHSSVFARNLIAGKKMEKWVAETYRNSDGNYAVSLAFCELLKQRYKTQFNYLPNVLDPYLEEMAFIPKKRNNTAEFIFLNLAGLNSNKNHKLLIDAFFEAKRDNINAKLWIAGGGELYNEIKNYIHIKGLENNVLLLGPLTRENVTDVIQRSDCMVLSSNYETFGVVLIESMLFGKPVIATKCGGPESSVNNSVGLLVDKEDAHQLSVAMLKMMAQYDDYDNSRIREYVIREFGSKAFLNRVATIYNKEIA